MSRATATASAGGPPAARLLERRAKVMKSLAHPSRLALVDALADGEKCVCDLQTVVGADLSTVSKHLSLLKDAGVLASERRGQWVWYRLRVPCITSFFACADAVFADPDADRIDVPWPPAGASCGAPGARGGSRCSAGCRPAGKRAG